MDDSKTDETAGPKPAPRLGPDGKPLPEEIGGPKGPEPTRHGEWVIDGRVVDF